MSGGWNTIESDAGVFTFLLDNLGVRGVQFEELISLDADYLAQLAPLYGVIFLFKWQASSGVGGDDRRPADGSYDYNAAQDLFFAQQTIQNACGTQALLSVLLNQAGADAAGADHPGGVALELGAPLTDFRDFTIGLPPEFRGEALSNSELIRDVHNSFARATPFVDETQPARAATDDDDVYHFIAYTAVRGTLWELDGLQPAPISHGACAPGAFAAAVMPVLQRRIARYPAGEIRFNVLAMIGDVRAAARALGDAELLQREEQKRAAWRFENALRRHNFVGFAGEVLRAVVRDKVRAGEYDAWVAQARQTTQRREEQRQRREG